MSIKYQRVWIDGVLIWNAVDDGDASTDMIAGYLDGRDPDSPAPSENRSAEYRHGFANGRDDLARKPRAPARVIRGLAIKAAREDADGRLPEPSEESVRLDDHERACRFGRPRR